ncbi:hypothetical protein EG328_005884 [Venturia inaequalis]|uniref:Uncharacterized protein n=1 Tax=Venturia inaequalis TaxID=5025 RepID=A0A8H3ZBK5_VENIN|nr:hypothetical protein EG328_005884 [Venturia inaequalis]
MKTEGNPFDEEMPLQAERDIARESFSERPTEASTRPIAPMRQPQRGKMCPGIEAVTDGFHERKIWNFWARFELDEYCTGVDPPEFLYEEVDVNDSANMHVDTPEPLRNLPREQTQDRRGGNATEQEREDFQKIKDVCEKFPGVLGHFRAMLEMEDKVHGSMAKMRDYGEFCIKTPNLARVVDNTIQYGTTYPEFLYEVDEFANLDKKNHKFQKELVSAMRAGEMPASASSSRKRTREEIEEDEGLNDDDRALIKKVKLIAKLRNT